MPDPERQQLNALVPRQLALEFNSFCDEMGLSRDRQVVRALNLFLDIEARKPPKRMVVELDAAAGRALQRRREESDLAELVGIALRDSVGAKRR